MAKAREGSVKVQILTGKEMSEEATSKIAQIRSECKEITVRVKKPLMHDKVLIIDRRIMVGGSASLSLNAIFSNNENMAVFTNARLTRGARVPHRNSSERNARVSQSQRKASNNKRSKHASANKSSKQTIKSNKFNKHKQQQTNLASAQHPPHKQANTQARKQADKQTGTMQATMTPRDRRMDITALCGEPSARTASSATDAYEFEVQTQMRQMSHHSWPLYRAEQDRILDDRCEELREWYTPGTASSFKQPAFLLDNPLVLAANSLHPSSAVVPAADRGSTLLTTYAPLSVPPIRSRKPQQHQSQLYPLDEHSTYTPISVLSSVALASSSSSSRSLLLPPTSGKALTQSKKRSRRMSNSERGKLYRSRRKSYVDNLEGEVQELQQEVQGLQIYGRILQEMALHTPQANGGSYSRVVTEYFMIFESGLPPNPDQPTPTPQQLTNAEIELRPTARQSVFVNTLMDANMAFCGNGGTKRLLKNWESFSLYHASLNYKLKQLQVIMPEPTAVVSADAVLRVRLTRSTIEKMFPHVLWNESLVQKLVGLEVEYQVANRFYFRESGKIFKYESEVDFLSAFMVALGSLQDAMLLAGPIAECQQRELYCSESNGGAESDNGKGGGAEDIDSEATE